MIIDTIDISDGRKRLDYETGYSAGRNDAVNQSLPRVFTKQNSKIWRWAYREGWAMHQAYNRCWDIQNATLLYSLYDEEMRNITLYTNMTAECPDSECRVVSGWQV